MSCSEEACESESFGFINFENLVDDQVEIFLDGNSIGRVEANTSLMQQVSAGEHVIRAVDERLILSDIVWDFVVFVESCDEVTQEIRP